MSVTYIGNISSILNCDLLISQAVQHDGETHTGNITLPPDNAEYENHLIQKRMAEEAGYTTNGAMEFRHFKPGKHFDKEFVDIFSQYVNAKPLVAFVSEIKPGRMAPWHYDIDPFEIEHLKNGELVRFHLHLSKPVPGHVFILEDQVLYNQEQGNVYQWNNRKAWHAGTNCGMVPKYLFNFKGYRN
jgi:hypothetical protein